MTSSNVRWVASYRFWQLPTIVASQGFGWADFSWGPRCAEHLKTDEDMVLYLEACLEEAGDGAAFIAKALSGEGNPSFATILKVISALGIKLHVETAPV